MKSKTKHIILGISLASLILVIVLITLSLHLIQLNKTATLVFLFLILFLFVLFLLLLFIFNTGSLKKFQAVQKGMSDYIDEEMAKSGMGVVIFSSIGKIIWISSLVEERFGQKLLNSFIVDYFDFRKNVRAKILNYKFVHQAHTYEIKVNLVNNILTIRDDSFKAAIIHQYELERMVIGELEIDNFQLLQATLAEEEVFNIQNIVISLLENLSNKYNLIYRQYVNGKFWIITDEGTLRQFQKKDFSLFSNLNKQIKNELIKNEISVSVSFAYGISKLSELTELSKKGLLNSQSRGGDQISLVKHGSKILTYGSTIEMKTGSSRTLINNISKKIIKKLNDPELKRVIIYGHKTMDLDALGAVYGLAKFFQKYDKKVYIQNSTFDYTTKNYIDANFTSEDKSLFIKPSIANKYTNIKTLIFICDTSELSRIENPEAFIKAKPDNIFVFDHHRAGAQPDFCPRFNQYIDTTASSASEIVTEFINFASPNPQKMIDDKTAQVLLNGIYMDTNQFQKSTSTKTFTAASLLYDWGATPQNAVDTLKMTEEVSQQVKKLLETLTEVRPGYFLAYTEEELSTDVVSIAADEVLRIKGRKAAFVIARIAKDAYKMSARGINTNVQNIAESLGGGGHFSAAAVISQGESLEQFTSNIKQAIVSVRNESNIN
ncbi:DHH family phosphoesterase [Mycoplasma iguanae]|uniref:DHH family phosphoesterase n=1 Tax=Mycoplasma iguanae TaxID=292461 RepID=A0ABY5R8E0_9MOLU|nr:DHH family phosphoesterase [Mycoplasma iguanae]UVD81753.1 DHH family phosphoesterase [Mycoplasma iguanae]